MNEKTIRTWVSEHFSAEPAGFKSKNLVQLWIIASPENFKFLYVQFSFRMKYKEVKELAQAKSTLYNLKI